ncbi:GIY-YIG nuclease family protein [Rhizobium laguerreae]|uniref:GIY-YIG nuclease family protein n=1 Tax=Rhizobium laguerreae TaxID=1076926 RepID=UPI001C91D5C9|nr:GIY-YIG nuclease family protein [Rhizobium laguerreae]MBY3390455.1 GIY-YIG nuclease family protein [Rhizobium laguerreae]MBY3404115.1 GIY-YIG nuclease family protein [Rhizobium laguerreae]MBY3411057.1 GIY-YIG nuclease family protein [Rhizobium laguerreae]
MNGLPSNPRSIRLRSFYGFSPEEDGYLGWSEEGARDRMLELIEDGDLFLIYGAVSAETSKNERHRVLGFLQIERRAIRDVDKASAVGLKRKRDHGWADKWSHAIPVVRAWRVDEPMLLETVAPVTYRPEAGQAIAVWSPELTQSEIDLALKVKVTEVNVFGEPPIAETAMKKAPLAEAFRPSCAFPGTFGERTSVYEDGPTHLYLARFEGDGFAMMGLAKASFDKSALIKIGVSNDMKRRLSELNSGFPPAAKGQWKIELKSEPYDGKAAAEAAEQRFKDAAAKRLQSLGGEFFRGDWTAAMSLFASIPGVSRFGSAGR